MNQNLEVQVSGGARFDVRHFHVEEEISRPYRVSLSVVSDLASVDFDAIAGKPATFVLRAGDLHGEPRPPREWRGICASIRFVRGEESSASASSSSGRLTSYTIEIAPPLWLLQLRTNYRIFQYLSELDIALRVLSEWGIEPDLRLDRSDYRPRKYTVQYGETDFALVSRMLEAAGISYFFENEGRLVLSDAPHAAEPREGPLSFRDQPNLENLNHEFATNLRVNRNVRPGKTTLADYDYRLPPEYDLKSTAEGGIDVEKSLELYAFQNGNFLFTDPSEAPSADVTPVADSRGLTRTDLSQARGMARRWLEAQRARAMRVDFETNAFDLGVGVVFAIIDHPLEVLDRDKLLLVERSLEGTSSGGWHASASARFASTPYRPALATPKPLAHPETATVVGPEGEEIHCDEFGRVKVQFHWDREGKRDENSSCWIHVSLAWAGASFGAIHVPRVGQEVLVEFLGADPDRPIIVGRVYTKLQQVPYRLPENKTQSGIRSQSTGGGGGHNEIMMEDKAGKELLRVHAERNEQVTVKRDASRAVGANQSITIAGVLNQNVGGDSISVVGGSHSVDVKAAISVSSAESSIMVTARESLAMTSKVTAITATDAIVLKVWNSEIILHPFGIVIDGPHVLINPSAADKAAFLATGKTVNQLEEEQAAQEQALAKEQADLSAERDALAQQKAKGLGEGPDWKARAEAFEAKRAEFEARTGRPIESLEPTQDDYVKAYRLRGREAGGV